ncbi:hypothetical protein GCM10011405_26860 [Rufibacter glacialis]|nr:hypothetical protein GCM10011405_26860 [Rufibacter glacialis]
MRSNEKERIINGKQDRAGQSRIVGSGLLISFITLILNKITKLSPPKKFAYMAKLY